MYLAATAAGSAVTVANLTQWSINIEQDTADVTSLGDSWKSFVVGVKGATASVSGFFADDADVPFDAFDQAQASGRVACYLYPTAQAPARFFSGMVWPTSVSVETSVGGAVSISANMTFDGAVTRA
jgi:hypothetical protein